MGYPSPWTYLLATLLDLARTVLSSPVTTLAPELRPAALTYNNSNPILNPLLSAPWDPCFSIRAGYSNIRLPATSVLMNAINAAASLANLDFEKQVTFHLLPLPKFPEVQIEFVPAPPLPSVEAKIFVWGLYGGINDIVGRKQYREVEFDLLWKGNVVAWLRFEKAESGTRAFNMAGGDTKMLEPASNSSGVMEITDTLMAGPLAPFSFAAQFTPYAKPFTIFQVFMAVLSALVQIARFPSRSIVKPLIYESQDYNARIVVMMADRRTPPYFEYIWLIEGLRRIPDFMFEKGKFMELGWKIRVNGKEIGSGFCEWTDWKAVDPANN